MATAALHGRYPIWSFPLNWAVLPGTKTIPDQISSSKNAYYEALEKADAAYEKGRIDVSDLEAILSGALAAQLAKIHQKAKGQ